MRYLYSFRPHNIYTNPYRLLEGKLVGWYVAPIKVKRPNFAPQRLHNEKFERYRKRLDMQKVYLQAMKNGINKINIKHVKAA